MIRSLRLNTGKLYIDVVMKGSFGTIYGVFSAPGKFDPHTSGKDRAAVEAHLRRLQTPTTPVSTPAPPAPTVRTPDNTPWPSTGWDDSELAAAAPVKPSPPCCSAYTPYPNRFTELTGHHRACPSFPAAQRQAIEEQIDRENAEQNKALEIGAARSSVSMLESLVGSNRRRLALPRGGANVRDYNATMAIFQRELDGDLISLEKAKAKLAALLK